MGLKLRNAFETYPLSLAKVIAGEDYLDREITSVNIVEVPTVAKWMRGGEMLFTSGFVFQGSLDTACQIIADLAAKEVAALAIKPGIYMNSIPQELIDFANSVHFPILQIPEDMPYSLFMQPILEKLINEQIELLKKTENIHNMLLKPLVDDTGLVGVCEMIFSLTGLVVILFDTHHKVLASYCQPPDEKANFEETFTRELESISPECFVKMPSHEISQANVPDSDLAIRILPIDVNRTQSAYLCMRSDKDLTNYDIAVIHYADTIFSLILQQQRALLLKEWQLKGECLDELIWQNYTDEVSVLRRAKFLNVDLQKPFMIVIFDISEGNSLISHSVTDKVQTIKSIQEKILHRINMSNYHLMMQNRGDTVVMLLSIPNAYDGAKSQKLIETTLDSLASEYPQMRCTAGIGKTYCNVQDVKTSFKEAKTALKCGKGFKNSGNIFCFSDLGEFIFLSELQDTQAMLDFYNEHISVLIEYDKNKHTDLIPTLKTYFDCQCNIRKTAEALFAHKNTVVYRLHRIEQLTNHDLSDSESVFQLQLCLKLMAILQHSSERDD